MKAITLSLAILMATTASAAVVRLDGPLSFCTVTEKSAPIVVCDAISTIPVASGPASHVRWSIYLSGTGQVRCMRWEHYQPIPGGGERPIATGSVGSRCSLIDFTIRTLP